MGVEDDVLNSLEDEEEVAMDLSWRERQHRRLQYKNSGVIDRFLGEGKRTTAVGIVPRYYNELLAWALQRYLERQQWEVVAMLGYRLPEPVYVEVATDETSSENLPIDGQMLIRKESDHFVVTIDANPRWRGSLQVEGPADKEEQVKDFIKGVMTIVREENFYRGKKIEFCGQIRFLSLADKSWDNIALDAETKAEIRANTVGFLKRREQWPKYGIPLKRGVLLAGEPGTGKTVVCKALISEAEGITCITTNGYALDADDYITQLYELAEDLSPSIVFIEDVDLIGQNRIEFGYQKGSALISLLAVLDGIEEHKEIVTVATTNSLETLDKALKERPSRFDRVIRLSRPSIEQRRELISRLCRKIPLDKDTQEYIARRAEGCTPAHIQEIMYSLVIQNPAFESGLTLNIADIDRAISRVNDKNRHRLGFSGDHDRSRQEEIRL